jgi:hypothetical protein
MKITLYTTQERKIATADGGGIRERWLYGLRLLRDPEMMSAGGGGLRHGVAAALIEAARARGIKLSTREIRYRIQCARTYETDSQIGNAIADFATWYDLIQAGFPDYEADEDEAPADHRTKAERARALAAQLAEAASEQLALFPLDKFEPVETPLKDLVAYAESMARMTEGFAERDRERAEYLRALREAVDDDLSATWADAHAAAFPGEDIPHDEDDEDE